MSGPFGFCADQTTTCCIECERLFVFFLSVLEACTRGCLSGRSHSCRDNSDETQIKEAEDQVKKDMSKEFEVVGVDTWGRIG